MPEMRLTVNKENARSNRGIVTLSNNECDVFKRQKTVVISTEVDSGLSKRKRHGHPSSDIEPRMEE